MTVAPSRTLAGRPSKAVATASFGACADGAVEIARTPATNSRTRFITNLQCANAGYARPHPTPGGSAPAFFRAPLHEVLRKPHERENLAPLRHDVADDLTGLAVRSGARFSRSCGLRSTSW